MSIANGALRALTAEQRQSYTDTGFNIVRGVFRPDEMAALDA